MKMSKLDELVVKYIADAEKIEKNPDKDLIRTMAKSMGPSIYNRDASTVAGSDPEELGRVRKNYLIKKLGLPDNDKLDEAIDMVMEKYGKSNPNKHRVVVYYLLAKHFKKEGIYK